MDHAVSVERMIAANWFVNLILGIANIYTVNVVRNFADDLHFSRIVFVVIRLPTTIHVWMRIIPHSGVDVIYKLNSHVMHSQARRTRGRTLGLSKN